MRTGLIALLLLSCAPEAPIDGSPDTGTDAAVELSDARCFPGQTLCAGACVDLQTDNANCGACGASCSASLGCEHGVCSCLPGDTLCSDGCRDIMHDPANCGDCGHACGADRHCNDGVCDCNVTDCSGTCRDTRTDTQNCGACGHACAATGQSCDAGVCACPYGWIVCDGACVDPYTDRNNCGGCGNSCHAWQTCVAGSGCVP